MNKAIKVLNKQMEALNADESAIKEQLQSEWNKVFNDVKHLQDAIAAAESSSEYSFDEYGEIVSWTRYYHLSDFAECREFLNSYLLDKGVIPDWQNDALTYGQGNDNIIINDDGDIFADRKCIIRRDAYTTDGESDISLRNQLIEQHMEKTGWFPGVFHTDRHGNVFPVNTQEKE